MKKAARAPVGPYGIFSGNSSRGRRYAAWWHPDTGGKFHIHWPTVEELAKEQAYPGDALPMGVEYARMLLAVRDGTAVIELEPGRAAA